MSGRLPLALLRGLGRLTIVLAAAAPIAAGGCHAVVGIGERCEKSCFDEHSRAICDGDGNRRPEACPAEAPLCAGGECVAAIPCREDADCGRVALEGVCEKAICTTGTCTVVARSGEACRDEGTCRGYACISPTAQLDLGLDASCLRDADGLVWCWGDNSYGQLGLPRVKLPSVPVLVSRIGVELGRAKAVSLGYGHACALLEDGDPLCWGNNLAGQSTGRRASPTEEPLEPTVIGTLPGPAKTLVTGFGHTCAQLIDGRIYCWGKNLEGEIGSGSPEPIVPFPTEVVFPEARRPVHSLSTDSEVTCVTDSLDVFCWGHNEWGEMGRDVPLGAVRRPVKVKGLPGGGVFQVAVSWGGVCAIVEAQRYVQCWGNNRWGQLGDGKTLAWGKGAPADVPNPDPRKVVQPDADLPLSSVTTLMTGSGSHICANARPFFPDILCWGESTRTELGVLQTGPFPRPVRTFAKGATQVALGDDHTCILRREDDGFDISCWGQGRVGQVGDGLPLDEHTQPEPARVRFPDAPGGLAALRASQ